MVNQVHSPLSQDLDTTKGLERYVIFCLKLACRSITATISSSKESCSLIVGPRRRDGLEIHVCRDLGEASARPRRGSARPRRGLNSNLRAEKSRRGARSPSAASFRFRREVLELERTSPLEVPLPALCPLLWSSLEPHRASWMRCARPLLFCEFCAFSRAVKCLFLTRILQLRRHGTALP
jgi:hypothetical protein